MSKKVFAAASAMALAVSSAFAQSETTGSTSSLYQLATLEPVVVSAARIEQPLSEVLPSLTVITREEIERAQAPTLIELLQGEPGIELSRNGGPGAFASLFLRGQNSNSTAVFIDGIRLQTDQIGAIRLNNIPTHLIERIEILRGNVSALYGEAAIGGVVNIFTKRPSGEPVASARAGIGSRNTNFAGFGLGGALESWGFNVFADRYVSDGFSARNPSQSATNPDDDGFERESLFVEVEKAVSQSLRLGVSVSQILSEIDFDAVYFPPSPPWPATNPTAQTENRNGKSRNTDSTLSLKINATDNLRSRLAGSWSEEDYKEFVNGVQRPSNGEGYIFGKQRAFRWDNDYKMVKDSLLFGIDHVESSFLARGITHKRKTQGLYAGFLGRVGSWDYQINLRNDFVRGTSGSLSRENRKTTWLAGIGWSMSESLRLTATASTGFRAPATGELYGWGGSPDLVPETHRSYETGLEATSGLGITRFVLFASKAENAIVYNLSDRRCVVCYENAARTENQGIEVHHRAAFGPFHGKASFVIQKPRNKADLIFGLQQGDRLARRADRYGALEVNANAKEIQYGLRVVYSGKRIEGVETLASYALVDATASHEIVKDLFLRFKLENLFNERYQLAYGFNAPGRGVFVSLEYRP